MNLPLPCTNPSLRPARPPQPRCYPAAQTHQSAQHLAGTPVTKQGVPSGRSGCKGESAGHSSQPVRSPHINRQSMPCQAPAGCSHSCLCPRMPWEACCAPARAGCTASWRPWRPWWRCAASPRPPTPRCRTCSAPGDDGEDGCSRAARGRAAAVGLTAGLLKGHVEWPGQHALLSLPTPCSPPPPRPAHQGASAMCLRSSAAMKSSHVVTVSMQLSNSVRALAYMSAWRAGGRGTRGRGKRLGAGVAAAGIPPSRHNAAAARWKACRRIARCRRAGA